MRANLADHIHMESKVPSLLLLLIGVAIFCYSLIIAPPPGIEGMVYLSAGIIMLFGLGICIVAAFFYFLDDFAIHGGDTVAGDIWFWIARVLFVLLALPLLLILVVGALGLLRNLTR